MTCQGQIPARSCCSALNGSQPSVTVRANVMRHHTKDKGDIAVGEVIAHLMREGTQVFLPISEHLPFDLIAVSPSMQEISRVQVKYVTARNGVVRIRLRRTHADRHGIHSKPLRLDEIDALAVFCPDTNKVYYVRRSEAEGFRRMLSLRLTPSKNGQNRKIRSASDFVGSSRIYGPVAQRIEPVASND